MLNTDQFIQKYTGKYVEDFDPNSPNQCVDLVLRYVREVMGKGNLIPLGIGAAYDLWFRNHRLIPYVTRVKNTPLAIAKKGDILVWGSKHNNGPGHTAICDRADLFNVFAFSQNDPVGQKCYVRRYSYRNILGFLRPKQF